MSLTITYPVKPNPRRYANTYRHVASGIDLKDFGNGVFKTLWFITTSKIGVSSYQGFRIDEPDVEIPKAYIAEAKSQPETCFFSFDDPQTTKNPNFKKVNPSELEDRSSIKRLLSQSISNK